MAEAVLHSASLNPCLLDDGSASTIPLYVCSRAPLPGMDMH